MKPSNNLENKTPSDTYWRVQLVWKKVQTHSSLTTTGVQSGPDAIDKSRFVMIFLNILGVTEILCSFRLVLEGKTGKEIPESSRLEFLGRFSANWKLFALSYAEESTFGLLNRGGKADLALLRTLLICQKSRQPRFWEVMDSFLLV